MNELGGGPEANRVSYEYSTDPRRRAPGAASLPGQPDKGCRKMPRPTMARRPAPVVGGNVVLCVPHVQNSPVNYTDPTGHNRDCGMGDPICNGDRSVMAGGWGSVSQQDIADPIEDYYGTGYTYAPGKRSDAVNGGTVHNGVDLRSDSTHEVGALSTGIVRVADSCSIDPCNENNRTPAANWGTGSVVVVEYPYQVMPDQVREAFSMTSDMSIYVQY